MLLKNPSSIASVEGVTRVQDESHNPQSQSLHHDLPVYFCLVQTIYTMLVLWLQPQHHRGRFLSFCCCWYAKVHMMVVSLPSSPLPPPSLLSLLLSPGRRSINQKCNSVQIFVVFTNPESLSLSSLASLLSLLTSPFSVFVLFYREMCCTLFCSHFLWET